MFKKSYIALIIFLKYELVKKENRKVYSYILLSYGHTTMTYKDLF